MNRREFLMRGGSAVLVLPLGTFLIHCGSSDGGGTTGYVAPTQPTPPPAPAPTDTTPPAAPPQIQGSNAVFTSSVNNIDGPHSHAFTVALAAFTSPPAGGVTGDTTIAVSHNHSLTITQADLQAAAAGGTVKKETTSSSGHTHFFTIVKVT